MKDEMPDSDIASEVMELRFMAEDVNRLLKEGEKTKAISELGKLCNRLKRLDESLRNLPSN
jgi:hypothetical protein